MKNLILLISLSFAVASCDKEEQSSNPLDQLPAATTTGKNTAGCLVNGQVFLPKGSTQFGPILSCFYQQDQDGYHFGLSINDKRNSSKYKTVQFSTNPSELMENGTYNFTSRISNGTNYSSNFGEYYILSFDGDINYITTSSVTGEIKINKLDNQQKIISGTFWYDAVNPLGEKVEIREGRFDMHYVN